MTRLPLDTSVLVAVERGSSPLEQFVGEDEEPTIAAITAAELLAGVHRATEAHREARAAYVTGLLDMVTIEPYDTGTARVHAELIVASRGSGRPRGSHDLIIAATARARGATIVTFDKTGFDDLPSVAVRTPA